MSDYHDQEDATQHAELQCLLNNPDKPEEYKWVVQRNYLKDVYKMRDRRRTALRDTEFMDWFPDTTHTPENILRKEETTQAVYDALRELKPDDKLILLMKYWLNFSGKQIAFVFNCRTDATWMRLSRAKERFAKAYVQIH